MTEEVREEIDKPVIGVLLQDLSLSLSLKYKYSQELFTSSLGASYVKFVEDSGGRCLPIALRQTPQYYRNVVDIVDGIVLPGGGFLLANSNGYTPSGRHLLEAVNSAANKGINVPVFGICLGFELMAVYFSGNDDLSFDILTEIERKKGWNQIRFTDESSTLPADVLSKLRENSLSHYSHSQSVTEEKFSRLGNDWKALATEKAICKETQNEVTVITMMESKKGPYFGVQFHPEKALHESGPKKTCTDISSAEASARTFSTLFAQMVQKHSRRRKFPEEELKRLIDRYTPEDVRDDNTINYDFVYLFKDGDLVI